MAKIQILGVQGYGETNSLKSNVVAALQALEVEARLEEISDVDELIKYDIAGIPALVVDGRVIFQKKVPSVADLKIMLKFLVEPEVSIYTLKNLLVPTDFSETAKGAFRFAQGLASECGASLKVVHVYHPEVDPAYPYLMEPSQDYVTEKMERLEYFVNKYKVSVREESSVTMGLEHELRLGFASEEIIRLSSSAQVDMVVLGTTGENGFLEKIFGSVSISVAQQSHCPVLLIPKGANFKGIKRVVYASDHKKADEVLLQRLIDFLGWFNADIHFVHIFENKLNGYRVEDVNFEQNFRANAPGSTFRLVNIDSADILDGLNRYSCENDIDLIVMATAHRSFMENLFHKSMTRKMAIHSKIPLLVLHFDE